MNSFGEIKGLLNAIVSSTVIHSHAHDLWETACHAVDFLNEPDTLRPLYIVLSEPGPKQEFVEIEDDIGRGIKIGIGQERYPGRPRLWRLGPFFAVPAGPGLEPASGPWSPSESKELQDGLPGEATPSSRFESRVEDQPNIHELKFTAGGEADAVCSCGQWRLLRMSIRPEQITGNQRRLDIENAFQQHLIATEKR